MGNTSLKLHPERTNWRASGDPGPVRAYLVGGSPNYTNVNKLPELLWQEFGVVVVRHIQDDAQLTDPVDLAIILNDMCDRNLARRAKDNADCVVSERASWSRLSKAMDRAGFKRLSGPTFFRPGPGPLDTSSLAYPQAQRLGMSKEVQDAEKKENTMLDPVVKRKEEPVGSKNDNDNDKPYAPDGLEWEGLDEVELMKWLKKVYDYEGIPQAALAKSLGRSPVWVACRLIVLRDGSELLIRSLRPDFTEEGALLTPRGAYRIIRLSSSQEEQNQMVMDRLKKKDLTIARQPDEKEAQVGQASTKSDQAENAPEERAPDTSGDEIKALLKRLADVLTRENVKELHLSKSDEGYSVVLERVVIERDLFSL